MSRGAPPWAQVNLRVDSGAVPDFGDVLRMQGTGRLYQVIGVRGKTLRCLVLPPDGLSGMDPDTLVWDWAWTKRKRKDH